MKKSLRTSVKQRAKPAEMADYVVKGYIKHDQGELSGSSECFSHVFAGLFPEITYDKIKLASDAYVDSLRLQDIVENDNSLSVEGKLKHSGWKSVDNALVELCRNLDIPESYAHETSEFFKYHGVRDYRFVQHVLNAEKILSMRITGDDYWSDELGALYLACIRCHDKHDSNGFEMGKKFAELYFSILLDARDGLDKEKRKRIW